MKLLNRFDTRATYIRLTKGTENRSTTGELLLDFRYQLRMQYGSTKRERRASTQSLAVNQNDHANQREDFAFSCTFSGSANYASQKEVEYGRKREQLSLNQKKEGNSRGLLGIFPVP